MSGSCSCPITQPSERLWAGNSWRTQLAGVIENIEQVLERSGSIVEDVWSNGIGMLLATCEGFHCAAIRGTPSSNQQLLLDSINESTSRLLATCTRRETSDDRNLQNKVINIHFTYNLHIIKISPVPTSCIQKRKNKWMRMDIFYSFKFRFLIIKLTLRIQSVTDSKFSYRYKPPILIYNKKILPYVIGQNAIRKVLNRHLTQRIEKLLRKNQHYKNSEGKKFI